MAHPLPFAALEAAFRLLSEQPYPVTVDGRQLGPGAPARPIPISELRSIALHPATSHDLQGTVVDAVIAHMQQEPATWTVVLGGILLPSMRCLADRIAANPDQASRVDIEAELLWRLTGATRRPPATTHRFAIHLLTYTRN